ncbi:MAG: DUF1844 domain-containing protein [Deltaproteobacteria bacterium]|nr:DUF1844 domain-containing protein [Deltaproteobacteria bacterium]
MDENQPSLNFTAFIMSLVGSAHVHLGIMPNPATNKTERNVGMAKQTIDLLDVLKEKTKGNLTKDEEELFEHMLFELRMKYIEESKKEAK